MNTEPCSVVCILFYKLVEMEESKTLKTSLEVIKVVHKKYVLQSLYAIDIIIMWHWVIAEKCDKNSTRIIQRVFRLQLI